MTIPHPTPPPPQSLYGEPVPGSYCPPLPGQPVSSAPPHHWPPEAPAPSPVPQPVYNEPLPGVWQAKKQDVAVVTCPSGQQVRLRRLGVQGLMKAGVLKSMDVLTALVDQKHIKRVAGTPQLDEETLAADPVALEKAMQMMYRVVCHAVVEPALAIPPSEESERNPDILYADEVDLEDIMFLLNYVMGGSKDLEKFRNRLEQSVRDLGGGEASEVSAERAASY